MYTYLPCFVGFYESWLDLDPDSDEDGEIPENMDEWTYNGLSRDEFEIQVCKNFCSEFYSLLSEGLSLDIGISNIEFDKLIKPQYYNFESDQIIAKLTIDFAKFKEHILKCLRENPDTCQYILDSRHKSCSGFISFYSHHLERWSYMLNNDDYKNGDSPNVIELETMLLIAINCSGFDQVTINNEISNYLFDYDYIIPH